MSTYQEQLARIRAEKAAKQKANEEAEARKLSPEQIKNWRDIIAMTSIGPFAYTMPEEMVQTFKDRLEAKLKQAFRDRVDADLKSRKP